MTADERRAETLLTLITSAPLYGFTKVDPYLMLAQAEHESGRFTSRLSREDQNSWGMMRPRVRPTTAIGQTPEGFAIYRSQADGAVDYLMRQQHFGIPDTDDPEQYMQATVASRYAEDPDYLAKWRRTYVPGQAPPTPPPPGSGPDVIASATPLLLVGAALYLLTR